MQSLIQKSCSMFVESLASKESIPGGGAASAMVGALGVALGTMVCNFTIGKKKYAPVEATIKALRDNLEVIYHRMLTLVDEDANAFIPLANAYSMPKDDPTYEKTIEEATINACKAPMLIIELCIDAFEILEKVAYTGNVMLISDVGCGAVLCMAAAESASLNVYINTRALKNRVVAKELEEKVELLLDICRAKAGIINEFILETLK